MDGAEVLEVELVRAVAPMRCRRSVTAIPPAAARWSVVPALKASSRGEPELFDFCGAGYNAAGRRLDGQIVA
jgi:hypothetical protein